ncbi:MAG: glycosyltransferase family 4 protein [Candidatus Rifleibacteriota bacterium]
MKIIYLHQYFNTPDMGGSTRSFELAKRLVKAGHEVSIITSWRDGNKGKKWFSTIESGICVYWLPVSYSNEMGFYQRIFAFIKFMLGATMKAVRLQGDLVFATSTPLTIVIPGIVSSKFKRVPFVFEVRDLWPEVPIALGIIKNRFLILAARTLATIAYKSAVHVIALAPGMKTSIQNFQPKVRISVIPNGCDSDYFISNKQFNGIDEKQSWLGNKKMVLYAGTIGDVNNVEYLVDIAAEMKSIAPDVLFVVIGKGKRKQEVKDKAIRKEVFGFNFFLLDQVSKKEIVFWYLRADMISVFYKAPDCATQNSVQNKFFDALSAGKPVVFEHQGWSVKLLEEKGGALFIPPDDPKSAALRIFDALKNESWLKSAGIASRRLGMEKFSRDKQAEELETVFQEVLEEFHRS